MLMPHLSCHEGLGRVEDLLLEAVVEGPLPASFWKPPEAVVVRRGV